MRKYFRLPVQNIASHGDTDIFPFPIENHIFFDKESETLDLLMSIHKDYNVSLRKHPPFNESSLAAVGYTGFRWATQVDTHGLTPVALGDKGRP